MDNFRIAVNAIVDILGDEFGEYPYQQMKQDVKEVVTEAIKSVRDKYKKIEDIRAGFSDRPIIESPANFLKSLQEAREIYYANKKREESGI